MFRMFCLFLNSVEEIKQKWFSNEEEASIETGL